MPRAPDDFDDDDFDGYNPSPSRGAGRGRLTIILIAGGVVLAMVVGMAVLFVSRGKRAEIAVDQARAEAVRVDEARGAMRARPTPPVTAWPRMVGTWTRTPAEKEVGGYPHQLEFRSNRTATIVRMNSDGQPIQQVVTVEVLSDQDDTARLLLRMPMGDYGYTFTLKLHGTLSLDDGKGGLVFVRAKS